MAQSVQAPGASADNGVPQLAAVVGGLAAPHWHLLAFVVPTVAVAAIVATAWWQFRSADD
jgi:hypothetical protein